MFSEKWRILDPNLTRTLHILSSGETTFFAECILTQFSNNKGLNLLMGDRSVPEIKTKCVFKKKKADDSFFHSLFLAFTYHDFSKLINIPKTLQKMKGKIIWVNYYKKPGTKVLGSTQTLTITYFSIRVTTTMSSI